MVQDRIGKNSHGGMARNPSMKEDLFTPAPELPPASAAGRPVASDFDCLGGVDRSDRSKMDSVGHLHVIWDER